MGSLANSAGTFLSSDAGQSMAFDVLGTGLNVAGSLMGGSEDAAAYRYQAGLYREAATNARIAGNLNEGLEKGKVTRQVAEQQVAYAANGIEAGSGSDVRVQQATQLAGDLDAAILHYNTMREAFGYDTQADLALRAAKNAKTKGKLGALGSLLSGASSLSSKWSTFKQSGAMGGGSGTPSIPTSGKITDPWGGAGA